MIATIRDDQFIWFDQISPHEENILWEHLSVSRPGAMRYIDTSVMSNWDGVYRFYNRAKHRCVRPLLATVRRICEENNLLLKVRDEREPTEFKPPDPDTLDPSNLLPGVVMDPWQIRAVRAACSSECGIVDIPTGGGKCLGRDTPVLMHDFTVKMVQDVVVGDRLMGDDGTPRTVLSVCSGVDDLYEVRQKNGDNYVVNSCHIMSLMRTPTNKLSGSKSLRYTVVDIDVQSYLKSSKTARHILKGYKRPVDRPEQPVPFDPYSLGVWLGDGISADCTYVLNDTTDAPIIEHLQEYAAELGMPLVKYQEPEDSKIDFYSFRLYEGVHKPDEFEWFQKNPVRAAFKELRILGNKHVPISYINNSRRVRLEVLAGVIDSDGYTNDRGDMFYVTLKKGKLPDSVAMLARSLGFRVKESDCWKTHNGIDGDWYRRLTISGDLRAIPTKVLHKQINKPRVSKKNPLVCGVEVVPVGTGEYFGFQIDGNRRFMLGDFTVTHNTEIIAGICTVIKCPTIILADQTIVVEQIRDRLALRKVNEEIGMFFAGIRPGGDELIVVGSIQSLQLPPKIPDVPKRSDKDTEASWKRKLAKYDQRMAAYKTRLKNAKWLRSIAKQAHMVIVDECVHEDSWVNTDFGLLRAKDVENTILSGVEVSAIVGGVPHRISGVTRSHKDAFLLKTSSNRELIASGNHRMSVLHGSEIRDAYLSDLLPGDLLLTPRSRPAPGYSLEWYHAGLFIGDGHFMRGHKHRVRFAVRKDLDDWRVATSGIVALWGGELKEKVNKRGDLVLVVDSQSFCDWLRSLGFKPGRKMGRMHIDFAVPSHQAAIGLLRGLFDAEGTGYTQTGRFAVTDEVLSRLVQQLLSYVGIGSSISFGARKNPKHLPLWRVNLSGENYSAFLETVGFGFSRKIRSYSHNLSSDRLIDPSPYFRDWISSGLTPSRLKKWLGITCSVARPPKVSLQQLVEFHKSIITRAGSNVATYADAREWYDVSDSKIARKLGISTMTSWNYRSRGDNSKWLEYVEEIRENLLSRTSIDPLLANYGVECVKSITACGPQPLIDFTVDIAHMFEANGLLVHNCDRAASSYYKDFFRNVFRGRRRYGFSGTPFEPTKPVECMTIRSHLGDIIAKETRGTLEENKRIIPIEYFGLAMEGDPKESSAYDIAYKEHITDSPKFWKLVVSLCKKYNHEGTLILVDKEALGENLKRELAAAGIEAPFIYGKTPKKKRNEILRAYEARKFKVLIGGKIINRGLDLKGGCENLIIATGGKLWSDFNQKIGRAVRHNSAGKGRVFDFFFRCNKYLYNHSKERLRSVVGMGYRATIVFPGLRVDGSEFVKSGFRVTKKMRGVK